MTEQYTQNNINRGGARRITQDDIDTTLAVPAVVLNADDNFVLCDDSTAVAYQVNLPVASEMLGKTVQIKNISGVVVTVASAVDANGVDIDTIDGAAGPMATALADTFSTTLSASPTVAPVPPAEIGTQANDWSVMSTPAAAVP
jgi:hypothetical protein